MSESYAPELVIGFVAPSGASFDQVISAAEDRLGFYGYGSERIRLSDWLGEWAQLEGDHLARQDLRIEALQKAGDDFRKASGHAGSLAFVAIQDIRSARLKHAARDVDGTAVGEAIAAAEPQGDLERPEIGDDEANHPVPQLAYLIWSLKNEKEIEVLRNIYGSRFILFSVYASRDQREEALSRRIADSYGQIGQARKYRDRAIRIIDTDESEDDKDFGQNVRDAYPLADFFIDATSKPTLESTLDRAIDIVFGAPFETPTRDEYGMFVAHAAALRSAEMGRQVGAAITTSEGDVVAVGTNEVPRGGGGQYWPEDHPHDRREFRLEEDTSDRMKRTLVGQILDVLKANDWIAEERKEANSADLYVALERTRLRDLIEFGRAVHAEMGAIVDAARRGVAVKGKTMFVTTFPCHHCARHVVASGIDRLVYIYPYPKSLAPDLHGDAIQAEHLELQDDRRVRFEPFLGVAPRQYQNFFTMIERKDKMGRAFPIEDPTRTPRLIEDERGGVRNVNAYVLREQLAMQESELWFAPEPKKEGT